MSRTSQESEAQGRKAKVMCAQLAGLLLLVIEQAVAIEARRRELAPPEDAATHAAPAMVVAHPGGKQPIDRQDGGPTRRRIVVSLADRKLALIDGNRVVKVYPVAVGAGSTPSPAGRFTIVTLVSNPTWYHPGKVVGPGKDNPVGTRWVGLDRQGYGIHGTNAPRSVGHAASHGCIRLRNRDVEELFKLVRAGDSVEITPQPETAALAEVFAGTRVSAPAATAGNPVASVASTGAAADETPAGQ
ncbi:MAG TPA: L,D-transpeptidase [Terriglobia bacterium]|nr:L,D-transpeptidase [Terriglobia bacterium]